MLFVVGVCYMVACIGFRLLLQSSIATAGCHQRHRSKLEWSEFCLLVNHNQACIDILSCTYVSLSLRAALIC